MPAARHGTISSLPQNVLHPSPQEIGPNRSFFKAIGITPSLFISRMRIGSDSNSLSDGSTPPRAQRSCAFNIPSMSPQLQRGSRRCDQQLPAAGSHRLSTLSLQPYPHHGRTRSRLRWSSSNARAFRPPRYIDLQRSQGRAADSRGPRCSSGIPPSNYCRRARAIPHLRPTASECRFTRRPWPACRPSQSTSPASQPPLLRPRRGRGSVPLRPERP
jgi:hypothetical protein